MEENMTSGVEAEVTDETSLDAAFDEGWNDEDEVSFEQEQPEEDSGEEAESGEPAVEEPAGGETSPEAPETTEESAEDPDNQQEPQGQEPPKEEPRSFELTYMGQKVTKSEDEVKALAQMGMDYPRLRQEFDDAKPILAIAHKYADEAGMSLAQYANFMQKQDLISSGRASTPEEAQRELDRQQREAEIQQWEQQRRAEQERAYQAQARRDADISEFRQAYPDIAQDPSKIPQEVWNAVQNGQTLTSAYSRFAEQQAKADAEAARAELEALKKNNANQAKSTGSMTGSGTPKLGRDPFLEGWDEPD